MGVLSMTFSSGARECVDIFFADLLSSVSKITGTSQNLTTAGYYIVAAAIYSASQFVFAFLCLLVPPRVLLLLAYAGSITLSALMMGLDLPSVNDAGTLGFVFVVFEAPIFPLIFAIGLRGLGRWTRLAACIFITTWGVGACVFPFVMLAVLQNPSHSVQYSFCVVVALFAAGTLSPLYLNLFRAARDQVDPVASHLTKTRERPSGSGEGPAVGGHAEEMALELGTVSTERLGVEQATGPTCVYESGVRR